MATASRDSITIFSGNSGLIFSGRGRQVDNTADWKAANMWGGDTIGNGVREFTSTVGGEKLQLTRKGHHNLQN